MTPSLATSVAVSPSFAPTSCLPALLETYGEVMTPEQIAVELEYSAGYVRKKIGCAKYQHLPWVMSIAPHRRRQGLVWVYATCGVAAFLESQRASLEPDSGFSKNLPRLLEAYGKAMTVEQVAKALGYLGLLKWALAHRRITLLASGAFLAASLAMLPLLPTGFLPVSDRSLSQLDVTLPPGTPLAQTDARLQAVSDVIAKRPEVTSVFATADGDDVATGLLLIRLKSAGKRALDQKDFEQSLRQEVGGFADMRFAFRTDSAPRELSVILTGNDPQALSDAAHALRRQMHDVQSAANVQVNEPLRRPELRVEPQLDEVSRLGISPLAICTTLRIATVGDLDANSARFNFADRQVPVRGALQETTRNDLNALGRLRVTAADGTTVPLHAVAHLRYADGDSRIERFDRQRRVSVDADLVPGYTLGEATDAIQALPALKALPEGVRQVEYGDTEYMTEMFDKFGTAMGLGVLMVFVVLVLLFKDFLQPITILTALPLSLGGLLIYGGGLDLPAVIGILMLMGIVTKNSILLVDFVIEKRRHGMARAQALVQSGAERARPIIMTTIAMAAGMVPAVLSSGADSGFRAPMAIAVIGGLLTSTLLSLVFVPVFFSLMYDLNRWLAPKLTSVTQADR